MNGSNLKIDLNNGTKLKKKTSKLWYTGDPEVEAIISTRENPKPLTEELVKALTEMRKKGASGLAAISSGLQMFGVPYAWIGTLPALGWDVLDAIENSKESVHVGLDVAPTTYPALKFAAETFTPTWKWDDYMVNGLNTLGLFDDTAGAFNYDILHNNTKYRRVDNTKLRSKKSKLKEKIK